jgi:hypothetical protein
MTVTRLLRCRQCRSGRHSPVLLPSLRMDLVRRLAEVRRRIPRLRPTRPTPPWQAHPPTRRQRLVRQRQARRRPKPREPRGPEGPTRENTNSEGTPRRAASPPAIDPDSSMCQSSAAPRVPACSSPATAPGRQPCSSSSCGRGIRRHGTASRQSSPRHRRHTSRRKCLVKLFRWFRDPRGFGLIENENRRSRTMHHKSIPPNDLRRNPRSRLQPVN